MAELHVASGMPQWLARQGNRLVLVMDALETKMHQIKLLQGFTETFSYISVLEGGGFKG